MPTQVDRFPGSIVASLDWKLMSDGKVWMFSLEEIEELGAKPETLRVYAHNYGRENGFKFKTKLNDEGLFLQAVS